MSLKILCGAEAPKLQALGERGVALSSSFAEQSSDLAVFVRIGGFHEG